MKRILVTSAMMMACSLALSKLPALDDAAKAKAAETAAKSAWQTKVDNYLLCKAQDKTAAQYMKTSGKALPKDGNAKDAKNGKPAQPAPAAATTAAAPAAAATPPAAAASGTPVATAALPPAPCSDPGPFAYNPPAQKPLEAAGAHSPSGTAASPPSVKQPSAEMAPAKK